jgi:UDP-N-acetylmuramate--alanine ligase
MKLFDYKNIHFIGIGGIGVSAIAKMCLKKDIKVCGSDQSKSQLTEELKSLGANVFYQHDAKNIDSNCDLVIYSPAIKEDNTEFTEAISRGLKLLSYPQALGLLTKDYFTIAIAGTHGKSTTTAMTSLILKEAELDPSVVIGTKIREFNNQNYALGASQMLVIEACEYKDSFLEFEPNILVVTNLEPDHLDYFKTAENYYKSYISLALKLSENDLLIAEDTEICRDLFKDLRCQVKFVKTLVDWPLKVLGNYNRMNASLAAYAARFLEIEETVIKKALENFTGTWRRQEYRLTIDKTDFYDDYGHHPTEIKATLKGFKEKWPNKKLLCIYEPHQYNRTRHFFDEFAVSFEDADAVIIPSIYKVRDSKEDLEAVSAEKLVAAIAKNHSNVIYGEGYENTAKFLEKNFSDFDIVLTMGAGPVYKILDLLEKK